VFHTLYSLVDYGILVRLLYGYDVPSTNADEIQMMMMMILLLHRGDRGDEKMKR
jgi:hypothetical protein